MVRKNCAGKIIDKMVIFLVLDLLISAHAAPHEGLPLLTPGGIGGIFKGPDSETIIQGPDGSVITSEQEPGAVVQSNDLKEPIIVADLIEDVVPLAEEVVLAPQLPVEIIAAIASNLNELPTTSVQVASGIAATPTLAPQLQSSLAPPLVGVSSTAAPLIAGSALISDKIHLGGINGLSQNIPVIQPNSDSGLIQVANVAHESSAVVPLQVSAYDQASNIIGDVDINTGVSLGNISPSIQPVLVNSALVSDAASYIQKIPRTDNAILVDDRIEPVIPSNTQLFPQIPQILRLELSRFLRRTPSDKNRVVLDDKLGNLERNEVQLDNRQIYTQQSKLLAPQLARQGVDIGQVQYSQVPLSQIRGNVYGHEV